LEKPNDSLVMDSPASSKRDMMLKRSSLHDRAFKVNFKEDVHDVFCCKYRPITSKDAFIMSTFIANLLAIIAFGVITTVIYSPSWIGWTSAAWIFLVEMTLLAIIKYYMTFYTQCTMVRVTAFFCITVLLAWGILFAVYISYEIDSDSQNNYWTAYLFLMCFYPTLVGIIVVYLRYRDRGHFRKQVTCTMRALMITSAIVIFFVGAGLMISLSLYSAGGSLCLIGIYLIVKAFMPEKNRYLALGIITIVCFYALTLAIVIAESLAVYEGLSVILLIVFFIYSVSFYSVYK
jgi:hypothetical protein